MCAWGERVSSATGIGVTGREPTAHTPLCLREAGANPPHTPSVFKRNRGDPTHPLCLRETGASPPHTPSVLGAQLLAWSGWFCLALVQQLLRLIQLHLVPGYRCPFHTWYRWGLQARSVTEPGSAKSKHAAATRKVLLVKCYHRPPLSG